MSEGSQQHRLPLVYLINRVIAKKSTAYFPNLHCLPDTKGIVLELTKKLYLNENETRQLLEASLLVTALYWGVPYQRNLFFTGREKILEHLYQCLRCRQGTFFPQFYALSGLGGIGKTQVVLEYAYSYAQEYSAVFWIKSETQETLFTSICSIARLLHLPEQQEADPNTLLAGVLQWLNCHNDWLLIYDDVKDLTLVQPFFPSTYCQGHVILTTCLQITEPVAYVLQLECFSEDEGIAFMLRRTKDLPLDTPLKDPLSMGYKQARAIARILGGLPLALDQAATYILETGCTLESYLSLYKQQPFTFLARRGRIVLDHPNSVATTFSLVFEQISQKSLAAIELLRLSAFLASDAISETLLTEGAIYLKSDLHSLLVDSIAFNEAMAILRSFLLIQRNSDRKTFSLHCLVRRVLIDQMSQTTQSESYTT